MGEARAAGAWQGLDQGLPLSGDSMEAAADEPAAAAGAADDVGARAAEVVVPVAGQVGSAAVMMILAGQLARDGPSQMRLLHLHRDI